MLPSCEYAVLKFGSSVSTVGSGDNPRPDENGDSSLSGCADGTKTCSVKYGGLKYSAEFSIRVPLS